MSTSMGSLQKRFLGVGGRRDKVSHVTVSGVWREKGKVSHVMVSVVWMDAAIKAMDKKNTAR